MHRLRILAAGLVLVLSMSARAADTAALDPQVLDRGSELAYRRALGPAADEKRLNADPAAMTRLRRIATRLVVSAAVIDAESKHFAWAVNMIPGAAPDVRSYPNGRMVVTEGLVKGVGLGDEEIASILAHAYAHALLGHESRRIASVVSRRDESVDPNRRLLDVAEATTELVKELRYTPSEISAADRMSIELLARAAYDPRAAGSAWRRLALGGKGIVERSPVSDERLVALDAATRAAVPLYDETRAAAEASARQPRPPRISGSPPR